MFENEVLQRVDFNDYPVVNIDDHSDPEEQEKGKLICASNKIEYQLNNRKGLQHAVDQGIEYLFSKHGCEWVFCLQQDVYPIESSFFSDFEKYVNDRDVENIGAIGFNVLDADNRAATIDSYKNYLRDGFAKGSLGIFFLSDSKHDFQRMSLFWYLVTTFLRWFGNDKYKEKGIRFSNAKRWFSEINFHNFNKVANKYSGLCSVELPIWAGVAINVKNWKVHIKPSDDFIFHLWFNDVAMQWLNANVDLAVASDLYLLNDQCIKEKYGFQRDSAAAGRSGDIKHVEQYGQHLINFESRWGFDYINPRLSYPKVSDRYAGTLVDRYFNHDCRLGPLKIYKHRNNT
tara:strand:+ start:143 stop:1174 length:1032 start_codon:yes stop_codon:yes gene_type:complete